MEKITTYTVILYTFLHSFVYLFHKSFNYLFILYTYFDIFIHKLVHYLNTSFLLSIFLSFFLICLFIYSFVLIIFLFSNRGEHVPDGQTDPAVYRPVRREANPGRPVPIPNPPGRPEEEVAGDGSQTPSSSTQGGLGGD